MTLEARASYVCAKTVAHKANIILRESWQDGHQRFCNRNDLLITEYRETECVHGGREMPNYFPSLNVFK